MNVGGTYDPVWDCRGLTSGWALANLVIEDSGGLMEFAIWPGQLEIREEGDSPVLTARFPLNTTATVRNRGRSPEAKDSPLGQCLGEVREFHEAPTRGCANAIGEAFEEVRAELEDAL